MLHNDSIAQTIPALRLLIELYQKAKVDKCKELEAWADYALHWACRRLEVFYRTRVSKAAAAKAAALKIGDLSLYAWNDQKSKMRDPKREIFHYEHVYPVSQLRHGLEALDPPTDEAVLSLVKRGAVAWILKEECKRLDAAGYRSQRPEDPWQAFREVGIEMVE